MKRRKGEEKQTKMPMDYKVKKQCIVNLSEEKRMIFDDSVGHNSLKGSINW
jgi:hypothetical protein